MMHMWHKKEEDPAPFDAWANSRNYKRVKVRCKAKMEEYNDQPSLKIEVQAVESYNHASEAQKILSEIAEESGPFDSSVSARGLNVMTT